MPDPVCILWRGPIIGFGAGDECLRALMRMCHSTSAFVGQISLAECINKRVVGTKVYALYPHFATTVKNEALRNELPQTSTTVRSLTHTVTRMRSCARGSAVPSPRNFRVRRRKSPASCPPLYRLSGSLACLPGRASSTDFRSLSLCPFSPFFDKWS